jgi:hopanoid biosynthesis associated protein HpnK
VRLKGSRLSVVHDASKIARVAALIKPKAVIVTADDFGLSREVNAGVIRAHREGILTGTSLMVAGAARDEAAALAHENPALDVGLHLVVCRGHAVNPAAASAGLTDQSGEFARNPTLAGMRYFFNRRMRTILGDEIRAQIELHLKLIGSLKHLDGHLNFHVHPTIADLTVALAVEYGIPCIRLPREPVWTTLALARDHAARKLIEAVIFRSLARRTRRLLDERGIRTTDWLFGLHQSGHLSEDYVAGVLRRLRPGTTEIYFHPATDVGAIPPAAEAQAEVAILTNARIREAIVSAGAQLTNFAELALR